MKTYQFCVQDFESKDYSLVVAGKSIVITQQQFDEGTWQDVIRKAVEGNESMAV
jgi:hypothetical protein